MRHRRNSIHNTIALLSSIYWPALGIASSQEISAQPTSTPQLWITNAHGNDVHIYEIGSWKLLDEIEVGNQPHGISATADGRIAHLSIENVDAKNGELVWIDTQSRRIISRLQVGPEPHDIECTPDGRWIYVPCNDGTWWIVDGEQKRVVKTIETGGRPHNTTISPDGRYMYLSPMGLKTRVNGKKKYLGPAAVTIVDIENDHRVIDRIPFSDHPRPAALSADGRLLFQSVDHLEGFEIADIAARQVIARVTHTINPELEDRDTRCHGLAIPPGRSEIWCCDVDRHRVHVHETESGSYEQLATIPLIGRPYWITFSDDGNYAFISIRSEGVVAVIETDSRKVLRHLKAGDTPKRTQVLNVPSDS